MADEAERTIVKASEVSLDLILRYLPAFICVADKELRFTAIRGAVLQELGLTQEAIDMLIGKPIEAYFRGPQGEEIVRNVASALQGRAVSFETEWEGRWFYGHIAPMRDESGAIVGTAGVGMDMSEMHRLRARFDAERRLLDEAQELAELGSWELDIRSGAMRLSREMVRILGLERVPHPMTFDDFRSTFHPDDRPILDAERERALRSCGTCDFDHRIVTREGRVRHVRSRAHVECDAEGKAWRCIGTMLDMTQRVEAQRKIEQLAYQDSLTGLPNRWLLNDRLRQGIANARRHNGRLYVLFIDLDDFKRINDSLGHAEGDILLAEVAERLRRATRDTDTVARSGGDEFVVLLGESGTENQARVALRRIRAAFREPFELKDGEYLVTASIGVASYPKDATTEGELLQFADTAMYDAKQAGRNAVRRYRGTLKATRMRRAELEVDLPRALREGEFRVYYQPVIDAKTLAIAGVEALLRWQHPSRGLLLPVQFMDVMENSQFMRPVGEWVLRESASQVAAWRRRFGLPLRLSLNVSARQLLKSARFMKLLCDALKCSGLDPGALELELTERTIVRDLVLATALFAEIRELGVGIAIDDFGTGYNSLSYVKHFPVTALKIDRSFVGEIGIDAFDEAISQSVAALGKALRIRVIAEGVETTQQLDSLLALGCDELQGYYFAPPLEAAEVTQRLELVRSA